MYHENLKKLTADHLRTHIKAYLTEVDAQYTGSAKINLVLPKSIDASSVVGGIVSEFQNTLPQYGIDISDKLMGQDTSGLWTYQYVGQINGLVNAGSQPSVDKLVDRHAQAVEMFIRRHMYLHKEKNAYFSIFEFDFEGISWSGAENVGGPDGDVWLAGFSANVSWYTSEDGPDDHA